jgi:hypothetical protein
VGTQRPAVVRMGKLGGQLLHWLKPGPEQVAQSGWQEVQVPFEEFENELVGQEETHCPLKADWPEEQVRQKLGLPTQVAHPLVQAVHVFPSLETTLPAGQVVTQFPLSRKSPGRHWSHCGWPDVGWLRSKLGIEHLAHLGGHVSHTLLLLLTTREVPWHVPVLSTDKHCPPRRNVPPGHLVQSVGLGPVQSPQRGLQEAQALLDWNLPKPQVTSDLIHWVMLFLS